MTSINIKTRQQLHKDISIIQLSINQKNFENAVRLFEVKWRQQNNTAVNNFLDYFVHQWVETLPGWYEGYAEELPSTNNALERTNRALKDTGTLRKRLGLSEGFKGFNYSSKLKKNWCKL